MNRRTLIIAGLLAFVVLVLVVNSIFSNHSKPIPVNNSAPVTTSNSNPPSFTGEDSLINIGVTNEQVTNMEQAFEQYFASAGKSPSQVNISSVQKLSVNQNATTPIWTIGFDVDLDGIKTYSAKMDYFNFTGIRLYLYSPGTTNLLYDSQDVGASTGT